MIIYRVYDDEWQDIMGIEQLKDFATEQILNTSTDEFIKQDLSLYYDNWFEFVNLANKVLNDNYFIQTLEEAILALNFRDFEVEEIEVW